MNPAMIPKTQSVCKHTTREEAMACPKYRRLVDVPDLAGDLFHGSEYFQPVAEPASTGEPPREGCLPGCFVDTLSSPNHWIEHAEGCPNNQPQHIATEIYNYEKQTVRVERAARPSEPSAPRKMIDVDGHEHDEDAQCKYSGCKAAPQTSAEPSDYLCGWCHSPLVEIRCPNSNCEVFGLTVARANMLADKLENGEMSQMPDDEEETAAPQPVSGDAPDMNDPRYCGACKHVHPPHEVDCRCYCDKVNCSECGPRIAARVMAGDAPKVEEIARQIAAIGSETAWLSKGPRSKKWFIEQTALYLSLDLRPYFPPASQTPNSCPFAETFVDNFLRGNLWLSAEQDAEKRDAIAVLLKNYAKHLLATPASTARTDGWVSVEEMSAPKKGNFLAWDANQNWIGVAWQDVHGNVLYTGGIRLNHFTHWRELPAAPGSVPQAPKEEK